MMFGDIAGRQDAAAQAAARARARRGVVVLYSCVPRDRQGHEWQTQGAIARRLASLKGFEFGGEFDAAASYGVPLYFVPSDTLVESQAVRALGIAGTEDLFGGVVPFRFVATKTITHDLPPGYRYAPDGWSPGFARLVRDKVLPGFSAYTHDDARVAARRLLERGKVRIKLANGIGGRGQAVIGGADELDAWLGAIAADDLRREGAVLEANLNDVVTHSVGQASVAGVRVSYWGTQRLTLSNHGHEVYGGSDLLVVRGGLDALLALSLEHPVRLAIEQAQAYHAAALASYPGLFASRINYDVAQGYDDCGIWHSGVLEQSWRIGGASAAEVAAIEAFRSDPALRTVRASTAERYGAAVAVPPAATIYYQGVDQQVGPLTKYLLREPHANP